MYFHFKLMCNFAANSTYSGIRNFKQIQKYIYRIYIMKKLLKSRLSFVFIAFLAVFAACNSNQKKETSNAVPGSHQVVVKEVLQVTQYTYLFVTENSKDFWIAVPKMEAKAGDTYYYINGMEMNNFNSKDLGRTFASIIFVDKLSTEPLQAPAGNSTGQGEGTMPQGGAAPAQEQAQPASGTPVKPKIEKVDVKVDKAQGGITVAQLFAKKESYENKIVRVKGQVTKVNLGIMNKNWIHIQDGTSFEGNIDLTITTNAEFKMGDVITFEGKISLKKDFGYGYYYAVIMEDGVAK
jgi:hypothetical protein